MVSFSVMALARRPVRVMWPAETAPMESEGLVVVSISWTRKAPKSYSEDSLGEGGTSGSQMPPYWVSLSSIWLM